MGFVGVRTVDPEAVARRVQTELLAATQLHCSMGIGDNEVRPKIWHGRAGRHRAADDLAAMRIDVAPSDRLPRPPARAAIADADGRLEAALTLARNRFVLVKPDRYVAAVMRPEDFPPWRGGSPTRRRTHEPHQRLRQATAPGACAGGLPSPPAGPERVKWQVHSVPGGTSAVETCG